jgi:alpha-tubulin suppressor-like RCC1 family protein
VPFDRPMRAIGVGVAFSCALVEDDVLCWGDNEHGELGEPGALDAFSPILVPRG